MVARFKKWWRTEGEKLAPMRFGKRAEYILFYYRFWIAGLVILLCTGLYVADVVYQSQREIVLQGFFTNDDYGLFKSEAITRDYTAQLTLDKNQRVVFDDVMYISMDGSATDYTSASNGKIMAYVATAELDFVVTSRPVFEYYTGNLPMADLNDLLPADLLENLAPGALLYASNTDGKSTALGLDMNGSRFVKNSGFADAQGFYILFVPHSAPNKEQLVDFIRYSFS